MQKRGYAIAFALVLLASCAGAFLGGRFLVQRLRHDFRPRPVWTPSSLASVTVSPTEDQRLTTPSPTSRPFRPTRTQVVIPTPVVPTPELATLVPEATGEMPPMPTEESSPTPAAIETPTPQIEPITSFAYALNGQPAYSTGDCPGAYVLGLVVDRAGNPLPGVRLWLVDEYGNEASAVTKDEQADRGRYDFPLSGPPRRFYLSVVDDSGHPISPRVEILHGLGANAQATCHWVNWQRRS